jgi:hypothetical protein
MGGFPCLLTPVLPIAFRLESGTMALHNEMQIIVTGFHKHVKVIEEAE